MGATNRLVYDPTDANSIAASSTIGSYLLAGDDGTAIGHVSDALKVDIGSVTDLDIRDLVYTQDSVTAHQGGAWSVGITGDVNVTQGTDPWVVSATDLEIRDLTEASGSVAAWCFDGSGNGIGSTTGSLDVNVTNDIDVDDGIANTAIENATTAVSTTAVNCVASALANRKYIFVANEGNKKGYFGKAGVTAANGFPLHAGMIHEFRIGPAVTPQFIGGTGASAEDYRVMELS